MVKDGVKSGASLNVYDCSIKKMYVEVFNIKKYTTDNIIYFFKSLNDDDVIQWIDSSFKIHNKSARASHIIKYLEACNTLSFGITSNRYYSEYNVWRKIVL